MIVLVLACVIGFPTTMLVTYRQKLIDNNTPLTAPIIVNIDWWSFWLFISGVFKDEGTFRQNTYYFTMGAMIVSLAFEKQCINWLTNRCGCNYYALQKFIELDMRKKCIDEKWDVRPVYRMDLYRLHYFYKDIDTLIERFKETHEERERLRKISKQGSKARLEAQKDEEDGDKEYEGGQDFEDLSESEMTEAQLKKKQKYDAKQEKL